MGGVSNQIYIKSVSPIATEASVKDFFRQVPINAVDNEYTARATPSSTAADDVVSVTFLYYPGSSQRYCEVTFGTSAGVTSAMRLNGHALHSVPTSMSVIDPGQQLLAGSPVTAAAAAAVSAKNPLVQALTPTLLAALTKEIQAIHTGLPVSAPVAALKALFLSIGGITVEQANGLVACASATSAAATDAGIGFLAMQSNVLNAIAKAAQAMSGGNIDVIAKLAATQGPREPEEEQIARTLYIGNLPVDISEKFLVTHLSDVLNLGVISDHKVDVLPSTGERFALVEFQKPQAVEYACKLDPAQCELKYSMDSPPLPLKFEQAKTTVCPREPENVSFNLTQIVAPPVPIAYQSVSQLTLEQKLAEAKARAAKMSELMAKGESLTSLEVEEEPVRSDREDSRERDRDFRPASNIPMWARRHYQRIHPYSKPKWYDHRRRNDYRDRSRHADRDNNGYSDRDNYRDRDQDRAYEMGRYRDRYNDEEHVRHRSRERRRYEGRGEETRGASKDGRGDSEMKDRSDRHRRDRYREDRDRDSEDNGRWERDESRHRGRVGSRYQEDEREHSRIRRGAHGRDQSEDSYDGRRGTRKLSSLQVRHDSDYDDESR